MNRFNNKEPAFKKGFRNGLIMAIVVGGVVYFQGETLFASFMTLLVTFAIIFPALWMSYRFTQKLAKKYQQEMEQKIPTTIHVGQTAPDFFIKNQNQETRTIENYAGKNIVLYFYPKDDTPGCTLQAQQFSDLADKFAEENTVILGISQDDSESHQAFIEKFNLNIELFADTAGEMCQAYFVLQEKEKDGEKKIDIIRSTFIINPENEVIYAEYDVSPEGHAKEILEKIQDPETFVA